MLGVLALLGVIALDVAVAVGVTGRLSSRCHTMMTMDIAAIGWGLLSFFPERTDIHRHRLLSTSDRSRES